MKLSKHIDDEALKMLIFFQHRKLTHIKGPKSHRLKLNHPLIIDCKSRKTSAPLLLSRKVRKCPTSSQQATLWEVRACKGVKNMILTKQFFHPRIKTSKINQNVFRCPDCQSKLRIHKGHFSNYYYCNNFPRCRYKRRLNIDKPVQ